MKIVRDFSTRLQKLKMLKTPALVYTADIDVKGGDEDDLNNRLAFGAGDAIGGTVDEIVSLLQKTDKEVAKLAKTGQSDKAEKLANAAFGVAQKKNKQAEKNLQKFMQKEVNAWLKDNSDAKAAVRSSVGKVVLVAVAGVFAAAGGVAIAVATFGAGWPVAVAAISGAVTAIGGTYKAYSKNMKSAEAIWGTVQSQVKSVEKERVQRQVILANCERKLGIKDRLKLAKLSKMGDTKNLGRSLKEFATNLKVLDRSLSGMRKEVIKLVNSQSQAMKSLKSAKQPGKETKKAAAQLLALEDQVGAILGFLDNQNDMINEGKKMIPVLQKKQQGFIKAKSKTEFFKNSFVLQRALDFYDDFGAPVVQIIKTAGGIRSI